MSLIQLPGLIDIHVHLRDPGQTEKEDFATGTRAALAGGFTMVCDMPNNTHLIDTAARVEEKAIIAREKIVCDLGLYLGTQGDKMPEFAKSKPLVLGLKIYLNETTGGFFVQPENLVAIFSAWHDERPILLHAEMEMIDLVIEACKKTGQQIHICHVYRKDELKKIITAKESGLPITCGVTPHHLFLTEADVSSLGPLALMKPPLAGKADVEFLWDHLDKIDVVESDHAPHTVAEKQSDHPPYGVPGLETTLPLLLTAVQQGRMSLADIIRLLSEGPRRILHLSDDKTTYVEVDTDEEYTIENQRLQTKCGWSPFAGWRMRGQVRTVFIRGIKVFNNGDFIDIKGNSRIIKLRSEN